MGHGRLRTLYSAPCADTRLRGVRRCAPANALQLLRAEGACQGEAASDCGGERGRAWHRRHGPHCHADGAPFEAGAARRSRWRRSSRARPRGPQPWHCAKPCFSPSAGRICRRIPGQPRSHRHRLVPHGRGTPGSRSRKACAGPHRYLSGGRGRLAGPPGEGRASRGAGERGRDQGLDPAELRPACRARWRWNCRNRALAAGAGA